MKVALRNVVITEFKELHVCMKLTNGVVNLNLVISVLEKNKFKQESYCLSFFFPKVQE